MQEGVSGDVEAGAEANSMVTIAPSIDIAPFIRITGSLKRFDENISDVAAQCERAEITNADTYKSGTDLMQFISSQLKQIEEYRVSVKRPIDDYAKLIQSVFVPLKTKYEQSRTVIERKMIAWRSAEEKRVAEEAARIRKIQEDEAIRIAAAAEARGDNIGAQAVVEMASKAPAPKTFTPITGSAGKALGKRVYWIGEPHDPMQILRHIVAGDLPISIIEFSRSGLNKVATDKQTEGVALGIKISKSETLR